MQAQYKTVACYRGRLSFILKTFSYKGIKKLSRNKPKESNIPSKYYCLWMHKLYCRILLLTALICTLLYIAKRTSMSEPSAVSQWLRCCATNR